MEDSIESSDGYDLRATLLLSNYPERYDIKNNLLSEVVLTYVCDEGDEDILFWNGKTYGLDDFSESNLSPNLCDGTVLIPGYSSVTIVALSKDSAMYTMNLKFDSGVLSYFASTLAVGAASLIYALIWSA